MGHTATTPSELGTERAGDADHLLEATQQRRILVTHNRKDFLLLHNAWHTWAMAVPHAGILVLPQGSAVLLAERLSTFALDHFAGSIEGQLHLYSSSRGVWELLPPRAKGNGSAREESESSPG